MMDGDSESVPPQKTIIALIALLQEQFNLYSEIKGSDCLY